MKSANNGTKGTQINEEGAHNYNDCFNNATECSIVNITQTDTILALQDHIIDDVESFVVNYEDVKGINNDVQGGLHLKVLKTSQPYSLDRKLGSHRIVEERKSHNI